jgi:hypothetical protein
MDRRSVSMNDLDLLLLFGNPSGMGNAPASGTLGIRSHGGRGSDTHEALTPVLAPLSVSAGAQSSSSISPLDLLEMDFEFQLGSPVSPLTPASPSPGGLVAAGRKAFFGV